MNTNTTNTKYFKTEGNKVLWCDTESFNPETDNSKEWKVFKTCKSIPEAKKIANKQLWREVIWLLKYQHGEV